MPGRAWFDGEPTEAAARAIPHPIAEFTAGIPARDRAGPGLQLTAGLARILLV